MLFETYVRFHGFFIFSLVLLFIVKLQESSVATCNAKDSLDFSNKK